MVLVQSNRGRFRLKSIGKYECKSRFCKSGIVRIMMHDGNAYWYKHSGRLVRVTTAELLSDWHRTLKREDNRLTGQMELF